MPESASQPPPDAPRAPAPLRAAIYIDGFNLYYPIHESGMHQLKWTNLWKLGELICEPHNATLVKAVFCTALPKHYPDKHGRHVTFNAAQRANGVTVILGHHLYDGERWNEKQTDINVALSLIVDGLEDVYDVAILVSADSDQAATAKMFAEKLKGKKLLAVSPPERPVSDKVKPYVWKSFTLGLPLLERCVMNAPVMGKTGLINRPKEYDPPADWVHPDDRAKGKPGKPPKVWSKAYKAEK
ncbi:NYN domain-containing protein [Sphingomonas sp. NFX23]|uniref:NYN domain-containing protein n=1 Tax=Sphingomonas sp. NFX23 TaxID=2819532 RepID=UPI003CF2D69B